MLDNLKVEKALVIIDESDANVILSGRNIPYVKVITTDAINTYDVLKYEKLIATEKALKKIEEVYA